MAGGGRGPHGEGLGRNGGGAKRVASDGLKVFPVAVDLRHVSIYAAPKGRPFDEVRNVLAKLVRNFEADPTTARNQIRDLLDNDREMFYETSLDLLRGSGDSRGAQYLVALLVANGMLLRALADQRLTREEAMAMGRAARRVDSMVEVTLARTLADSAMGSNQMPVTDPARLMDILCEVADAGRIMPSLMRLMRHPNTYLRSKAVKMIGRGSLSPKWVMGRLSESDPRVRANAIESLWGVDSPEARSLLSFAINDANNRVVGNALLGLYYLGDSSALTEVVRLASNESELFRASAAWVMGETGDPRFLDSLRPLIAEPDQEVRKRAFTALSQIKVASAQPPVGDRWNVAARLVGEDATKGWQRIMVAVAREDMRELPKVLPLQFYLSEGTQYVTTYKVTEKVLPESMSVVFVVPRSRETENGAFYAGVAKCLRWKRPSDLWSVLPYMESGDEEPPQPHEPEPPVFTSNAETLGASLNGTLKRIDCTDLWTAVWRATMLEGQHRGKRHVIVLSSAEEDRLAGHGLLANMQTNRTPMQAVCSGPNARLQEFCRATHSLHMLCGPEEIVEAIEQAYLNLLGRYEIAYLPAGVNAAQIKVRVQTPEGWGETVAQLGSAEEEPAEQ
jgi:hypothetical protein